jgi:hypothetical protein
MLSIGLRVDAGVVARAARRLPRRARARPGLTHARRAPHPAHAAVVGVAAEVDASPAAERLTARTRADARRAHQAHRARHAAGAAVLRVGGEVAAGAVAVGLSARAALVAGPVGARRGAPGRRRTRTTTGAAVAERIAEVAAGPAAVGLPARAAADAAHAALSARGGRAAAARAGRGVADAVGAHAHEHACGLAPAAPGARARACGATHAAAVLLTHRAGAHAVAVGAHGAAARWGRAHPAASAAVGHAARDVGLAAVGGVAVAVAEARRCSSPPRTGRRMQTGVALASAARAAAARRRGHGGAEVGLAAVGGVVVAVAEARGAARDGAAGRSRSPRWRWAARTPDRTCRTRRPWWRGWSRSRWRGCRRSCQNPRCTRGRRRPSRRWRCR